jgi:hypothetical protein
VVTCGSVLGRVGRGQHSFVDQHRPPGPRPPTLMPQLSTASHGLFRSRTTWNQVTGLTPQPPDHSRHSHPSRPKTAPDTRISQQLDNAVKTTDYLVTASTEWS